MDEKIQNNDSTTRTLELEIGTIVVAFACFTAKFKKVYLLLFLRKGFSGS